MKTKKLGLAAKTFIGFGLGIVIGLVFKEKASVIKPLGTIFLNMIKMLVVPMVFFSITAGVASLGDLRKLRNIGVKVVGLYAITSAISVGIGLLVANMINPGKGFDMTALSGAAEYEAQGMPSVLDTLIDMFPTNVVQSFANQNMLQIIVFSIFLGVALIMLEERGKHLADTFQSLADVMYKITAIVMEFSPIGVCALLADSVGAYGLSIFGPLGKLILTVYAADVILVLAMYIPMVALMARFPLKQFFQGIWKVWVITASTTSSAGLKIRSGIVWVPIPLLRIMTAFPSSNLPPSYFGKRLKLGDSTPPSTGRRMIPPCTCPETTTSAPQAAYSSKYSGLWAISI